MGFLIWSWCELNEKLKLLLGISIFEFAYIKYYELLSCAYLEKFSSVLLVLRPAFLHFLFYPLEQIYQAHLHLPSTFNQNYYY